MNWRQYLVSKVAKDVQSLLGKIDVWLFVLYFMNNIQHVVHEKYIMATINMGKNLANIIKMGNNSGPRRK